MDRVNVIVNTSEISAAEGTVLLRNCSIVGSEIEMKCLDSFCLIDCTFESLVLHGSADRVSIYECEGASVVIDATVETLGMNGLKVTCKKRIGKIAMHMCKVVGSVLKARDFVLLFSMNPAISIDAPKSVCVYGDEIVPSDDFTMDHADFLEMYACARNVFSTQHHIFKWLRKMAL